MRTLVFASVLVMSFSAFACRKGRVSGMPAPVTHPSLDPAKPYEVGSNFDITQKIRSGLAGTRTKCELEAPSIEEQREWRRFARPREHGKAAIAVLLAKSDHDVVSEVSMRLLDEEYTTGLDAMTAPEQNIHLITQLQGEVMNGGFHQYFANSSGDCASKVGAASKAIDSDLSRIVALVVALGPSRGIRDGENIRSTLGALLIPGAIVSALTAGVHSKSFEGVAVVANVKIYPLIPALWFGLGRKKFPKVRRR